MAKCVGLSTLKLILTLLPAAGGLVACGEAPLPVTSELNERHEVPATNVTAEDAQAFLDHFDDIVASPSRTGEIAVTEFLSIMPMLADQRQIIARSFPGVFAVTCGDDRCTATTRGRRVEAVMEVSLSGISHPKLALDPTVITGMKRRADGLEFCETQGMSAKKFFVTRKVQGIYMRHQTGTPTSLIVNVDNDEKFICD